MSKPYKIVRIPKGNGKFRKIHVLQDAKLKKLAREVISYVTPYYLKVLYNIGLYEVPHGFIQGRNPVTNAMQHIGYDYTLSLDLKNFFDRCTIYQAFNSLEFLKEQRIDQTAIFVFHKLLFPEFYVDEKAPQGYPTSPMISNVCLLEFDFKFKKFCETYELKYTRYADDLTISWKDRRDISEIISFISDILPNPHTLNRNKYKLYCGKNGSRRIVTGVGVDYTNVYPTRKQKRRLRAALHQGNESQANGLSEWIQCKIPRYPSIQISQNHQRQNLEEEVMV